MKKICFKNKADERRKTYEEIVFLIRCIQHQISQKTKKKKLPFSEFKLFFTKTMGK